MRTPAGEEGLNYLCAGYKLFFHHIDGPMRYMTEQLRRNGAPSTIMRVYAESDRRFAEALAKAGRNGPCPCGSGRKGEELASCGSGIEANYSLAASDVKSRLPRWPAANRYT